MSEGSRSLLAVRGVHRGAVLERRAELADRLLAGLDGLGLVAAEVVGGGLHVVNGSLQLVDGAGDARVGGPLLLRGLRRGVEREEAGGGEGEAQEQRQALHVRAVLSVPPGKSGGRLSGRDPTRRIRAATVLTAGARSR